MSRIHLFIPLALIWSFSTSMGVAAERAAMEKVYNAWKTAMQAKTYPRWAEATATHRRIATKNLIVSQRQPFPAALFNMALRPPDVVQLRFVEERVKGDIGHLAYFGKANVGLDPETVPDNLIIIRFVRESGQWKYDYMRFFNLSGIPEIRASLAAGSNAYLKAPDFELPDSPPPIRKEVTLPDFIGHIEVTSIGYRTLASVNGHPSGIVENDRIVNIIIGGLKDGQNALHLDIEPLPDFPKWDRKLEVKAHVVTGDNEKPTAQVFEWTPDDEVPVPAEVDEVIWANIATIKGR